jgi:hypothetical protein
MTTHTHASRGERGFSMFIVIMVLFVTSMFVAAAFAAANGDLPQSGPAKDRKQAYAAAEAGLNFYLTHLNQDPDYWTKCDQVPAPNGTEVNPVNQVWNGTGSDPRRWRNVTGSSAQYTLEILPTGSATKCDPNNQTSILDMSSGEFRVRATGRPDPNSPVKRSIIGVFRRHGFIDFLWFTYYEDMDPQAYGTQTQRTTAQNNCGDKVRSVRAGKGCDEIQFITGDKLNGPVHSNDSILICGTPTFGRDPTDKVEIATQPGTAPSRVADSSPCTDGTNMLGTWKTGVPLLDPPDSNDDLKNVAISGGRYYQGKTYIRFNTPVNGTTTTMTVRNKNTVTTNVPVPANGVIYVDGDTTQGACSPSSPSDYPLTADYNEDNGCGNVYVSGTYASSMTIAAADNVIIAPTTNNPITGAALDWTGYDSNLLHVNNAVLGLIANNFVRVGHPVSNSPSPCHNASSTIDGKGLKVDAAILSLAHSFINDNYSCGNPLGNLTVFGAIAQYYRGVVGSGGGAHGFIKDYNYDNRLRYRSPPYFLNPVDAAWSMVRSNEQVPAR